MTSCLRRGYKLRGISILSRSHFPSQVPIIPQLIHQPRSIQDSSWMHLGCIWDCTSVGELDSEELSYICQTSIVILAILALEMNIGWEWKCPFTTLLPSLRFWILIDSSREMFTYLTRWLRKTVSYHPIKILEANKTETVLRSHLVAWVAKMRDVLASPTTNTPLVLTFFFAQG